MTGAACLLFSLLFFSFSVFLYGITKSLSFLLLFATQRQKTRAKRCLSIVSLSHLHLLTTISRLIAKRGKNKTYNTRDSLVVSHPTTSLALTGLSMGERTGSRIFQWVWSYV
ncbi:hypothetical protein B0T16DRAFT_360265, partial [Cercophora newfieldiana]